MALGDFQSILSKLQSLEHFISDALSQSEASPLLAVKITEAMILTSQPLFFTDPKLANQWKTKVGHWFKNYMDLFRAAANVKSKVSSQPTEVSTLADVDQTLKPQIVQSSPNNQVYCCDFADDDPKKIQLVELFRNVDPVLKNLCLKRMVFLQYAIVNAFYIVMPPSSSEATESKSCQLESFAFDLAFSKLPQQLRQLYEIHYEQHSSNLLYSLFNFLRFEITSRREQVGYIVAQRICTLCDRCFKPRKGPLHQEMCRPLFSWNKPKHPIYSKIFAVFAKFPCIKSSTDLRGLEWLLSAMVSALDLVPPKHTDASLQSKAFNLAFSRLPIELKHTFQILYKPEEFCLYSLFRFVQFEHSNLWQARQLEYDLQDGEEQADVPPKFDFILCHRCYRVGHTGQYCKNPLPFYW